MSDERRQGMDGLVRRVDALEGKLDANTEMTRRIEERTAGVVEMFDAMKGGFKVLGILGQIGKWVAYIAGAVTAVWAALHIGNGIRPK